MKKKRKQSLPVSGEPSIGDNPTAELELPSVVEEVDFSWEAFDYSIYENSAVPKNKITIVCFSEADVAEAQVIKQAARKEDIRSTIFYSNHTVGLDSCPISDEALAESIKHASLVVTLSPDNFKHLCMRTWISGRVLATFMPNTHELDPKFAKSPYVCHLNRVHQIILTAKKFKTDCKAKMISNIKTAAFSLMEY